MNIRTARPDGACVVQITDTHISRSPGPQFDGVDTTLTLRGVLDAIRARPRAPDLVLLTGDLVDEPSVEAYRRLLDLLEPLSALVVCLPGNHDDPRMLREQMRATHVSTPAAVDADSWCIVLLDDWIPDSSRGRLAPAELERLETVLREAGGRPALVAVHHAPVSVGSPWMDAMGMENPDELFGILDRFRNVRALVCGHIHQEFRADRNGVPLLGTPSTCVQFAPGATEYEVDAQAPGYREMLLRPDGTFETRIFRVPPRGLRPRGRIWARRGEERLDRILAGQSAIVTGAGRGFGRAIALHLATAGASVTVTSRTRKQLDETVGLIEAAGGKGLAAAGDATDGKTVSRIAAAAEKQFGAVSILVNNAGVPDPFGPVGEIDPDRWWAAQAIHVYAPLLFMNALLPGMSRRGTGRIINVSAFGGTVVAPYLSAYCVGKAAQIRLTEHVAAEYREHGVSAFAIDPGFVITELAEQTLASPDAQRWLPGMMERLRGRRQEPDAVKDLDRCGQRCVDLASGRYDELSGRYMGLDDDLEGMLKQEDKMV